MTSSADSSDLDLVPCGVMRTSEDGTVLRANRLFCDWLGYDERALAGKRRFQDLLTMGGRIFHQTHWAPLLRMQGSISEVKLELLSATGTAIPVVLNAVRRQHGDNVVHDIAAFVARDRDRYEQELLLSRKRLEELHAQARERAVSAEQMVGIVSHDLRNPLAAIGMGVELLGAAGAKALDSTLPRITRAVNRANTLIADLLDFTQARLGSGLKMSVAPLDVHRVVAGIVEDLQNAHPTRTLRHVASGPGECSLDAHRIDQLLGNLVANAAVYGRAESPITVTTSVDDATCKMSVHNLGDPIAPALVKTIFEPLTRGTAVGSARRSVGLGLFIVREIAKAHGGTAAVTSTAEHGTMFTVTVPRWPPPGAPA